MNVFFDKQSMIKWLTVLAMILICFMLPSNEMISWNIKLFLAITVGGLAIVAFELLPTMVVSILMPCLYGFFKIAPIAAITSPWSGNTMLMVTGALFMAASLEDSGLLNRIAYYLLCKVKGNYFVLIISIFFVTVFLSLCTSGRGYMVMAPLCAGLVVSLGGMKKNLGAVVATAVMIGGCTSHSYIFQPAVWGVLLQQAANVATGIQVTPLMLLRHNWPMFFISAVIMLIVMKWYKCEVSFTNVEYFQNKLAELGKMTYKEKINLAMMVILLLYIFTVDITKLDINWGFAIIPWLVFFFKGADSKTLRLMNWEMIFFVAACMGIGTVASSIGLGNLLGDFCVQLLNGYNSITIIFAVLFVIVFALNFLMTPIAIFALITVPMINLGLSAGIDMLPILYSLNAYSEAILFPYEYIPYLIVYSFGMISMKDFIKINILRSATVFLGFLAILIPYWGLIGII